MRDLGPVAFDHRGVTGELSQHRHQDARVSLQQVRPKFVRVRRGRSEVDVDSVAVVMVSSIEAGTRIGHSPVY